jgi:hypothetical protein
MLRIHEADQAADTKARRAHALIARQENGMSLAPQFDPSESLTAYASRGSSAEAHAYALSRATASRPSGGARSLLQLQRRHGNRHVQPVLALSRLGTGEAEVSLEVESAVARGGGQALDAGVRLPMESAFGTDFSGVRVHTDSKAHSLNEAVNATAFTTGQDILFRQGAYNPAGSGGRELLAHELTHVVQQRGTDIQRKLTVGGAQEHYELEANQVARVVGRWLDRGIDEATGANRTQAPLIQRQLDGDGGDGGGGGGPTGIAPTLGCGLGTDNNRRDAGACAQSGGTCVRHCHPYIPLLDICVQPTCSCEQS